MHGTITIICCETEYTLNGGGGGSTNPPTKCMREYREIMAGGNLPPSSYIFRILAKNGVTPINGNKYHICLPDLARMIRNA